MPATAPIVDTRHVESIRSALEALELAVDRNGRRDPVAYPSRAALLESEARIRRLVRALPAWCPGPDVVIEYLHSGRAIILTWRPAPGSTIRVEVARSKMTFTWVHGEEAAFEKVSGEIDTNLALPPALFAVLATAFGQGPDQRMVPTAADADSMVRFGAA